MLHLGRAKFLGSYPTPSVAHTACVTGARRSRLQVTAFNWLKRRFSSETMATYSQDNVWWSDATVALVTGANKGIGLEIAHKLGALGFTVIVTSRDEALGAAAMATLKERVPQGHFEYVQADITDAESVNRCAEYVRSKFKQLTVLVNNAGMAYKGNTFGAEEAAITIICNLKGTRRMTEAMLPLLTENARIVNVSSRAGRLGQLTSDALKTRFLDAANADEVEATVDEFVASIRSGDYVQKGWSSSMYGISKLGETAYTFVLARELREKGIMVNACCPGYCATDMSSHRGPKSAADGADTPVWLATLPPADKDSADFMSGLFFAERSAIPW